MVWNKPNDNKPELDPWGDKNSDNKNRPDNKNQKKINRLDIKYFFCYIKNIFINTTHSSVPPKKSIHPLIIISCISFFIWSMSGFYTIKEAERGVVTSFGKFSYLVQPGLNWRPIFINEVKAVNVETVRELATSGVMLTSDENVVHVEMNVQYKITNPADYLFSVCYPDDSLRQATDSALRGVIGHSTMDRVLTEGRTLVRSDTQKVIEETIKPYKMGITILDVNFQTARPPEEVKAAFDDAIAARENREQYVREAEAYSNEVEPKAYGQAQRILEEARAYSSRIILEAQGEVDRFSKILPEYRKAKKITLKRLYIESMERLLSKNKKIFIDKKNSAIFFVTLDKFFSNMKSINKKTIKNITFNENNPYSVKKDKSIDYFPSLSPKSVLEQRRINSIRSDLKNSERK
ncbi:FtsH protease activity modulator HflK [Buchnera aphidicola]|uniref:Protein HflK n=1 Tax=Buchnera aphidicola str. USDA (Myzus persicae) TaxID=1009856 RepID=W0P452_BUCMP|nr:FtsH protease activity modulator HflK [Buchnera aphidicola]AHG59838.1 Hflk [Buchnera aphidicola str. USDA (Myzus persicae)]AHG60418.1 Hflk [Buchnera aphidicola str. W106 (Myzus persicae)]AHG60991.1 Hflk [Buchnera aphidicola str. G002 (Myzus persicae)]AHG61563.1 Hflk [Buchnera aphidicola str. F009 (Myzus persicae)]WAI02922.1 MAG: FtsH protease activity modulator HflK [Buchnera aphidicola (Myzus persicae)]